MIIADKTRSRVLTGAKLAALALFLSAVFSFTEHCAEHHSDDSGCKVCAVFSVPPVVTSNTILTRAVFVLLFVLAAPVFVARKILLTSDSARSPPSVKFY